MRKIIDVSNKMKIRLLRRNEAGFSISPLHLENSILMVSGGDVEKFIHETYFERDVFYKIRNNKLSKGNQGVGNLLIKW